LVVKNPRVKRYHYYYYFILLNLRVFEKDAILTRPTHESVKSICCW